MKVVRVLGTVGIAVGLLGGLACKDEASATWEKVAPAEHGFTVPAKP